MRKQPAMMPDVPLTDAHSLSRRLFKLVRGQKDLEFESNLEYPTDGRLKPARPWDEVLTIMIEVDHDAEDDEEEEDELNSVQLTVTTYSDNTHSWVIQIDHDSSATAKVVEGTDLDAAFDKVYATIWPPTEPDEVDEEPAKARAMPYIKLVQQSLTHGPQTINLSYLEITKFNSVNELVTFHVPCAMVGYAIHIADIEHFLKAIGFESHVLGVAKHIRNQRVLSELKERVKGKAAIEGSGKISDQRGIKYIAFLLELHEDVGTINGMIDIRPEDELSADDDEEFDD